jgi:hypothetical protein
MAFTPAAADGDDEEHWVVCDCIQCLNGHHDDCPFERRRTDPNPNPERGIRMTTSTAQTWDTTQLQEDFEVLGFAAPYVVVVRKADGAKGVLQFAHRPRVYFDFEVA